MPLYRYKCQADDCGTVTEMLRRFVERNRSIVCPSCGKRARYIISAHHQAVDGIYSYAENTGDPNKFERQQAAIRAGKRTIDGDTGE